LPVCLVRTALFASATSLVSSYAVSTLAQIPVFRQPEPEPEPGVSPPPAASPPATIPPAPPTAGPPPATPAAPAPGLLSSRTPPAKTDVITEPRHAPDEEDAEDETVDARPGPRRKWYGWQTLAADGASLAALTVAVVLSDRAARGSDQKGVSGNATGLVWFGALGYELAPGIIHFVHRNPGRGFASMGLRLGMPLAGAFLGASVASGCSGFACQEGGAGVGILLGMGGAIAIDAAVLAYDDPKKPGPRGLSLTPLVAVTRRQAWLGIGGAL
jgi:hypothetical protein